MHQTRESTTTKLPINRKGTKYIARASSHINNSVPAVIAIRDMLKLSRTAREVRKMIHDKILKINGRPIKDYRQSILLFNILEADKAYELSILPTKKFVFNPAQHKDMRLCKVVGKRLVRKGLVQLNLHDGTNVLTKEKINTGDSVYIDFNSKIKKHIPLSKEKEVFVFSGKYAGQKGKISKIGDTKLELEMNGGTIKVNSDIVVAL